MSTIGFIGFGLIGGSIARTLKTLSDAPTIIAFDYYTDKPNYGLELALADGTIDKITKTLAPDFSSCDYIFLCAPVLQNIKYLEDLKPIIKQTCIITDVGSVKGNIHEAVDALSLTNNFIGGHPMAGSEKTGYHNSSTTLLENAYYILTPTKDTNKSNLQALTELVIKLGALPITLDYKEHDMITAAISHVPHLIAVELVNLVKNSDDQSEKMRQLAAGGFKDLTRIASSSPIMWQNICLTNTESIEIILSRYITSLQSLLTALHEKDSTYLYNIFDEANTYRSSIPNSRGLMNRIYEVFIDITDEVGAIATIATLLGSHHINLKNIGIIHNREFEQGVLRIEFNNEGESKKAVSLLKEHQYTIYER